MSRTSAPIKLAGSFLQGSRHVCAFFATPDDEYRTILPFTIEGLAAGERLVHVFPRNRGDHVERLRTAGVDVDRARENHQLELLVSEQIYLQHNDFDQAAMMDLLQKILISGRRLGFPLTRIIAHAEHVILEPDSAESFLEYESRLTDLLVDYPDPVVCTYDLNRVSAAVVIDVMRTHPMAIVGGVLQCNPFYLRPDEFLQEIRECRARAYSGARVRHSNTRQSERVDLFGPDSSGRASHGYEV
ncbi:MAG TPA: MEDS domain-containing protein [Gemmatimonadaceae bacterium]|jgi:hypothetical protein|nr:MEDS domain-containing protein [Gemmatimonadaceae bacterium]